MAYLLTVIVFTITVQAGQLGSVAVESAAQPVFGYKDISIEFIVAEQIRYATLIEQFDFTAYETGFVKKGDSVVPRDRIHQVKRGKSSYLITTENWNQLEEDDTGRETLVSKPSAARVLVTPELAVRWLDVSIPRAQIVWATDTFHSATKNSTSGYEFYKKTLEAVSPGTLSFGLEGRDSLCTTFKNELLLSGSARRMWRCELEDEDKVLVRASRYRENASSPDLVYRIAPEQGGVVSSGEFTPYSADGTVFTRKTRKSYRNVDGVHLLACNILEEFDRKNNCIEFRQIVFSNYKKSQNHDELGLESLEMPTGMVLQQKLEGGGQAGYVWRDNALVNVEIGQSILIN